MQLNSIRNCKKKKNYWLQKIEDYNLTKQKYFECKICNKLLCKKTYPNYILHSLQDQLS
jgi:hypothetical protein